MSNDFGQLGLGNDKNTLTFTSVPHVVDLPPIIQVSCGDKFTICVSEEGYLFSFGSNCFGQLGLGNFDNHCIPLKIDTLKDIAFVDCGENHVFCKSIICNDIYSWGRNDYGQLGFGNQLNQNKPLKCDEILEDVVDIKCCCNNTLILTSNQEVYSCGSNSDGQLGRITDESYSSSLEKIENLQEIVRIECGCYHSLCIDVYNNLFVFGNNIFGQLGLIDSCSKFTPTKHPTLSNIIDVSKGGCHTFVKTSENEIYAFGYNKYAQLGTKTSLLIQNTPIRTLGNDNNVWGLLINRPHSVKSARK